MSNESIRSYEEMAVVRRAGAVEGQEISAARASRTQTLLGPEDGVPNVRMRRITMGEGGGMPPHVNSVEHQQYVLRGRAHVGIGEDVYEVSADDVLYIPAGAPHSYEVIEAPFEYLSVAPNDNDQMVVLDITC